MLGALWCTQVKALEAEADLQPLSLHRRYLLSTYAARVLPIENHPLRKMLLEYYPFNFYQEQRRPLPTTGLIHHEFISQNLTFSSVPVLTPQTIFPIKMPIIDLTLHTSKKPDLPPEAWQACFADILDQYPAHTPIFCDGSKTSEQTATGVWSASFTLKARLNKNNYIFTAELFAIFSALKFLEAREGFFLILSDSLGSLRALQHVHSKSHFLVLKITHLLSNSSNKFILAWVPSHMGIKGNELADKAAREALSLPHTVATLYSDHELKRLISAYYHAQWEHQWKNSSCRLRLYKNNLGQSTYLSIQRTHQVPLTRIRLGATKLTHLHLFTGGQPARCTPCHTNWTTLHLLLECPLLQQPRLKLRQNCQRLGNFGHPIEG
jgi:ribonuclease HI